MVWDDQKVGDYPFQTEFSYRMNQMDKSRWYAYNAVGGTILGILMAILVFLVPESIFSDPTRLVLALFIGAWPIRTMEKSAERTTKVAQAAMAVTFGLATLSYAVVLLIQG